MMKSHPLMSFGEEPQLLRLLFSIGAQRNSLEV